jgi:hypothetical protein
MHIRVTNTELWRIVKKFLGPTHHSNGSLETGRAWADITQGKSHICPIKHGRILGGLPGMRK